MVKELQLRRSDHFSVPTIRKVDAAERQDLSDFGKYVADCLPKFVQKVQLTAGNELEVLIAPEGVVPVLQFLKDHHAAQFANLIDIAGMDVPSRKYRFEVSGSIILRCKWPVIFDFCCSSFTTSCHCVTIHASESRPTPTNWPPSIRLIQCSRRPIGTSARSGTCMVCSLPITQICDEFWRITALKAIHNGEISHCPVIPRWVGSNRSVRKDIFNIPINFQLRYDDEKKRVVCEPLELAQEFRKFDLSAPWEQFPNFRNANPATEEIVSGLEKK